MNERVKGVFFIGKKAFYDSLMISKLIYLKCVGKKLNQNYPCFLGFLWHLGLWYFMQKKLSENWDVNWTKFENGQKPSISLCF